MSVFSIRVSDESAAAIDRVRGRRSLSQWVREAINAKLDAERAGASADTPRTRSAYQAFVADLPAPSVGATSHATVQRAPGQCTHPSTARVILPYSTECGLCGAVLSGRR